jgi:dephospho-CoA kinase
VHLFGLTGGIASGKSTVAKRLRARGVPVIDADALAREVVAPGTPGLAEVVSTFGEEVLAPDGSLDRKALAHIVFADDALRKKLNAITHPRISVLTMQRATALAEQGEPLACYEAALIVENGIADAFRPLVVAAAPEELQIERVRTRDGSSVEDARARVRAQGSMAEKIRLADFVIETTGTLEDNARRTDEVLDAVCQKVGAPVSRYLRP